MPIDSLALRIFASVLLTFSLTVSLVLTWQHVDRAINLVHLEQRSITRVSVAATKLLATVESPAERQAFIANINAVLPLHIGFTDEVPPETEPNNAIPHVLADLGPGFDLATVDGRAPVFDRLTPVIITLPDGQRLATSYYFGPIAVISPPAWAVLAIASCALLALFIWLSRSLTRQLAMLSRRAIEYDPVHNNRPFPVSGPNELRNLAIAFNRMVERISGLLQSQRLALSAVGHDLRTPITRLRLRAETLPSGELRQAFLRDLGHMSAMIDEALSYLRGEGGGTKTETTDLAAILEAVANDFRDLGRSVTYIRPARLQMRGHSENLFRLFDNLLANAARYADTISIEASGPDEAGYVTVVIDDDGPGIAPEPAAQMTASGPGPQGMGLPIAQAIAKVHGGTLRLGASPLGGLRVEVTLLTHAAGQIAAKPVFFESLAEIGS